MSEITKPASERPFLDRYFGLTDNGTDVRTEFIAGITTFLTMVYIVFVNPQILSSAGMDKGAVFVADVHCGRGVHAGHGALRQLPDRARAGHGAECLLRLHRCAGTYNIHVAAGARRRVLLRGDLLSHLDLPGPRIHHQLDSEEPQICDRRRRRALPRYHRAGTGEDRGRGLSGDTGYARATSSNGRRSCASSALS